MTSSVLRDKLGVIGRLKSFLAHYNSSAVACEYKFSGSGKLQAAEAVSSATGGCNEQEWQTNTNPHESSWKTRTWLALQPQITIGPPAATAADPGLPRLGKVPWNKIKKSWNFCGRRFSLSREGSLKPHLFIYVLSLVFALELQSHRSFSQCCSVSSECSHSPTPIQVTERKPKRTATPSSTPSSSSWSSFESFIWTPTTCGLLHLLCIFYLDI